MRALAPARGVVFCIFEKEEEERDFQSASVHRLPCANMQVEKQSRDPPRGETVGVGSSYMAAAVKEDVG